MMRTIRIVWTILVLTLSPALLGTGFITLVKASSGPVIEWTATYGAQAVVQTEDGGYLFAGSALGLLVKTDSLGNIEWNRTYEGTSSNSLFIFKTADGGYVATGVLGGETWLIKVDAVGDILWNKTYEVDATCVVQTGDGGYIFVGNILLKIDAYGDVQWSKSIGGSWVAESEAGYIISSEAGGNHVQLIRTDTEGHMEWNKTQVLIDPTSPTSGGLSNMIGTNDGGIVLTGWSHGGPGSHLGWIYKFNSSGDMGWKSSSRVTGGAIVQTADGGYARAGEKHYAFSPALIKINQTGHFQWEKLFGSYGEGACAVIETVDGGFVVATAQHIYKFSPYPRHNIAISEVTVPSYMVKEGDISLVNVTVQNDGDYDETAEVFLFDNSTLIDSQNVTLSSGTFETITFFWSTTGVGLGQHTILANATIVEETYLGDNTGQTTVLIMGGSKITINTVSSVAGFYFNVSGTLTDDMENTISGGIIHLYYMVQGVGTWNTITSVPSETNGHYSAIWIPTATGDFTLKAEWNGNATHFGTSNNTTVTVNPTRNISISLSSSTSFVGFKVEINGTLTCNGVALSGASILLSYSVTGGESWNDITLVDTISGGGYSAVWIPTATGNYLVKATWAGDSLLPRISATVSLAVTSFEEQNVFAVESNSTISSLAFNSTSNMLSFSAEGATGTTGYAKVFVAKELVENISDLKVYVDEIQVDYVATSTDKSWLLHFVYEHSTHGIVIIIPEFPSVLILPLLMTVTLVAVALSKKSTWRSTR